MAPQDMREQSEECRCQQARQPRQRGLASAPANETFCTVEGPHPRRLVRQKTSQVGRQLESRSVACFGILLEAFEANRLKIAGEIGTQLARRSRLDGHHATQRVEDRVSLKHGHPGQKFVQNRP